MNSTFQYKTVLTSLSFGSKRC